MTNQKKPTKTTLQTLAGKLGISKTTVSLVLKGDGDRYRISRKTQQRVLECAEKEGFVPDFLARALATNKTATIGIIFPDVHESFMSEMLKGIESVFYESDYSLMISTSGFDTEIEDRNIRQMLHKKVDGLILVPYVPIARNNYKHSYMKLLSKTDCPFVFADRLPENAGSLNWIIQDDFEAAEKAVCLLFEKGCRSIGCMSFNLSTSSINNRLEGFKSGIEGCGLPLSSRSIILLDRQDPHSDDITGRLLRDNSLRTEYDGLLITTGGLAHKTGYLLRKALPADKVPVIAKFGRDPDYFDTGMIQIIQPNVNMGIAAARVLLDKILNRDRSPIQKILKSRIIDIGEKNEEKCN
ncbi:MAG: LacI family DNA-binding transcriptional regulator [Spirochaetales bacterium]|uniref:LacI family DNA-binding transcriptional regulator n=1 Tax=Candidatus Thalassospirochaeta sargassi TaxID=3119039 RepID=A0AAJ1IG73_9SPIO|nr:LacI family DNA-binding transcriptional regulator [Spirochaetales bacterium]